MSVKAFEPARKYVLKESVDYAAGAIVSKIITKNDGGNVSLFSFDKGQQLSEHTAPFDALVQVIEGIALIRIGSHEYEMHEGDIIVMPANIPHAVEARDNFKMMLTMIKA